MMHTHTYVYIHVYTPFKQVGWVFAEGEAAARDPGARRHPPRSARMGLEAGSPYAHRDRGAYWWQPGLALAPPQCVLRALMRQKGSWVGPQWREKEVCHLPRAALSGTRGASASGGSFGGVVLASVLVLANTYHTYSIHAHTYNPYNTCTYAIWIEKKSIHYTYNTYTYALSEHLVRTACMCMYCNTCVYV
jgi:hypothetical protein